MKGYSRDLDTDRELIAIRFHGESTLQGHQEARDAAARIAHDAAVCRVLVDMKDAVFPSIDGVSQFMFAQSLLEAFPSGTPVAIIDSEANGFDLTFPKTVASNRGLAVESFRDETQAVFWLCHS